MIDVAIDSTFKEDDGKISVHATVFDTIGKPIRQIAVQVDKIEQLKEVIRPMIFDSEKVSSEQAVVRSQVESVIGELKQRTFHTL